MRPLAAAVALAVALPALAAPLAPAKVDEMREEIRRILGATWKGGVDELRVQYNEAARQRPSDPTPRVYLAFLTFPSDDSWNQFKAITQQDPQNPWAHLGMALVYLSWKMRDQAQAELVLVLKADPRFYPALVAWGDLLALKDDLAGAEAKYREALAIAPDPQARAGLGLVLLKQGKTGPALGELRQSYDVWPDQPPVVQALYQAARDAQDLEKAATYAEQLCALKPRDRAARKELAALRFELGQKEKAALEYERLLRLGNVELPELDRLIGLFRELKQGEKEEQLQLQKAGMLRESAAPLLRLAELARARSAHDVEEGHLLEAIEREPTLAEPRLMLGRLRGAKGVLYEAIDALRGAAALQGEAAQTARVELEALEKELKLAPKPAKGGLDAIHAAVARSLDGLFAERLALKKDLAGDLKLRVRVGPDGVAQGVDVLADTLGDPLLAAHAWVSLKDAVFPKQKREPVFEFELGKKAKKKK